MYEFHVFQANLKDAGKYNLIVSSSVFQESSIKFQIIVESYEANLPATCSQNSIPLVVFVVTVVVLVIINIILTIGIIAICKQKNNATGKMKLIFVLTRKI